MITTCLYLRVLQVKCHFTEGHLDCIGFFCPSTPFFLRPLERTTLVCDWARYFYFSSTFFCLFSVLSENSTPGTFTTIGKDSTVRVLIY